MGFYPESEKTSKLGVELSKSNGKVDFDWLKRNGIDFVMLKIGGRGYESGVISLDEQFTDYIEAAKKADSLWRNSVCPVFVLVEVLVFVLALGMRRYAVLISYFFVLYKYNNMNYEK